MKIVLPGTQLISEQKIHKILKEKLNLPQYYGENLDALLDCLTSWVSLPLTISWENFNESKQYLGSYADKLLKIFQDAEKELDGFKIEIKE